MKMQLFNVISVIILITHHSTNALPDTNIHIQHYDGPVYVSTPKPDFCPLCNSPIKPACTDNANPIDVCTPEVYPETTIYIKSPGTLCETEDKEEKPCGKSSRNCNNNPPTENTSNYGIHVTDNSKVSGTMLHTDTKGVHKIPLTCTDNQPRTYGNTYTDNQARTYGNTYTGTANLGTHFGYDTYGTGNRPCVATEPLSSYLPITATQNSCYQVPILTYNSDQGVEPTLIPQKFMYSLILDGDVAPSQNGYTSMCSYY